ncbi:hypothetical protein LJC34_02465 [Oscillospiraceae bacterium OttesenSCG-928-G22]|nr:hypothetical protein [Oscillospiraceae bacterium OttesenSCG-928-G22]
MRLQKTIVQDGKQIKNQALEARYIYENAHPAIISAKACALAQLACL